MSSWISQGVLKGATGATGSTGPTGPAGTPTGWFTTFASFTIPAVGSTVAVTVASASDIIAG